MSFDATTLGVGVSVLSIILGAMVKGALWQRDETIKIAKDANDNLLRSEAFETRTTKIVASALTGTVEPLTSSIRDLESRQRDHGKRLGELGERVAAIEGRAQTTRTTDPGKPKE
jgi:predicted RNase H-like nuclease (RuvC/YqgF family)